MVTMIKKISIVAVLLCGYTAMGYGQDRVAPLRSIDEGRVQQLMQFLADTPAGFGRPYSDRTAWDSLRRTGKYDGFLKRMQDFRFPAFSEDDYFSLSNGTAVSSARGLEMMRGRAKGLAQAAWAECLENRGAYVKVIEDGLRDLLKQPSWVSPRNDFDFKNFKGVEYSVELTSALYAHTIAQTLYMMGNKLPSALREEAVSAIRKRVFEPVLRKIANQDNNRENAFLSMTNNYNHVCLSGVVGAALTVLADRHERAVFAYIGEYYSKNGISGFGDDGYCTEGVGYYNYGFGHFALLRETLWQATTGRIDLFQDPKVARIARYGIELEIINGIYPAIADSRTDAKPDSLLMYYLSRNLGLGIAAFDELSPLGRTTNNLMDVMLAFPNSALLAKQSHKKAETPIRSYFEQSAVLVMRPSPNSTCQLGVAFKGGNNQESHNHNDVGSYSVVLGQEMLMGDMGSIPYTADIFTPAKRYTYKTLASFGHPVPLVDDAQQETGAEAVARVLSANFSENRDTLEVDLTAAYHVVGLRSLLRKLVYDRAGLGSLSVKDQALFDTPKQFETALTTRAKWRKDQDGLVLMGERGNLRINITASSPYDVTVEEISEGGTPFTRIGLRLRQAQREPEVTVQFEPYKDNYTK